MLATNTYRGTDAQYFILVGQAFYTSEATAYAETIYDLNIANLPFAESVPLAKVTYKRINGSTAAGHAQILRVTTITSTNITISQSSPTSHNNLADIQGGTPSEQYHLSSTEYSKVQELSTYNIATPAYGPTWTPAPAIPIIKTDGVMEIGKFLDFHITSAEAVDYKARISCDATSLLTFNGTIRFYKFETSLTSAPNVYRNHYILFNDSGNLLHYVGGNLKEILDSNNSNDRWADMRYRAYDAYDRTTAITYTPEVVDPPATANTTITGNLVVTGTINGQTIGGSHTLTHITSSTDGTLEEGIFVETTGEIHYEEPPTKYVKVVEIKTRPTVEPIEPATFDENGNILTEAVYGVEEYEEIHEEPAQGDPLNPYENCICKVKRAHSLNKNIVGVLTSVNPVKFATHGDVLIKVISDTYQLGDILIPTIDGYGKKATSGEIYDSLFMMIPRAKITALITNIPNTVSAILL